MSKKRLKLKDIEGALAGLELEELRDLHETLSIYIEARASQQDDQAEQEGTQESKPAGYIEQKMINGYGPYEYLRWAIYHDGKRTLKSKYLGKSRE